MLKFSPSWIMIGLDVIMVVYTLWVLSLNKPLGKKSLIVVGCLLGWLGILHIGLSNEFIFLPNISGIAFLAIIFAAVGVVGGLLFILKPVREILLGLDQRQLLLFQGIRVFFGATFLMQASLGALPLAFGIIDGYTHISAGFFGLIAAFSVASSKDGSRRAWFANIFGLADILIVASSLALILLPQIGPHHSMMYAVFLPAPLWLWFHVVSISKLIQERGGVNTGISPTSTNY